GQGPLCAGFQPLRTGAAQRAAEAGGGVEAEAGGGLTQGVATAPAALRSPDKRSASGRAHGSAALRNTGRFPIPYSRSAPRPASGRRGRSAACAPWRTSDAALPPTAEGTRMRFAYPGYAEASPRVARPWRRHGAQTVPLCLEAKGGP